MWIFITHFKKYVRENAKNNMPFGLIVFVSIKAYAKTIRKVWR